jgi:hypothetical protein
VRSQKGDVPEIILYIGVISGLLLHSIQLIITWNPDPSIWSFGAAVLLSVYGYISYRKGMWGGADMLGLIILGSTSAYYLKFSGSLNLIMNFMLVGFIYAIVFGLYHGIRSKEIREDFIKRLKSGKKILITSSIGIIFLGVLGAFQGVRGLIYPFMLGFMILTYFFMKSVEEVGMTTTVDASEVEKGDVLADGEIKGVTEDEIEELEGEVELKEGIRFMPVFPVSLAITVAGFSILEYLIIGL